jgi:uncharacterized delta-60 repeat protein
MIERMRQRFFIGMTLTAILSLSSVTAFAASDGTLDSQFGTGGKVITDFGNVDEGYAVAIQADGKIIVAGYSTTSGYSQDFALARFTTTGELDSAFGTNGKVTTDIGTNQTDVGYAVALQTDGKIIVAGLSWASGTQTFAVVRYTSTGDLDSTFGTGGRVTTGFDNNGADAAYAIHIQADGKITVAGVSWGGTSYDFAVARYTSTGELDATFGTGGTVVTDIGVDSFDSVHAMTLQTDGKIIVVGSSGAAGSEDFVAVRYTTSGELDTTFGIGGMVITDIGTNSLDAGYAVAIQTDGKILIAGVFDSGTSNDFAVLRYSDSGELDTTFGAEGKVITDIGTNSNDYGEAVVIQADGKIIVTGTIDTGGPSDIAVVRYLTTGDLDTTFGDGGKVITDIGVNSFDPVYAIALQIDGKIVIAGGTDATGSSDFSVVRYASKPRVPSIPGWLMVEEDSNLDLPNTL